MQAQPVKNVSKMAYEGSVAPPGPVSVGDKVEVWIEPETVTSAAVAAAGNAE